MGTQSMILYLAAALIGFAALLVLAVLLLRGQGTSVDANQILRTKSRVFAAVQNIELDFRNLGAGLDDPPSTFPAGAVDTLSCLGTSGAPCRVRFYGRVDPNQNEANLIEYNWTRSTLDVIDANLSAQRDSMVYVGTFVLRRVVDGSERFAIDRVRSFRLQFSDSTGVATEDIGQIREVDVTLRVLIPATQSDEQMEEVTWRSVFRPANLARD